MSETDVILQKMGELVEAVKANKGTEGLDVEKMTSDLTEIQTKQGEILAALKDNSEPLRKGDRGFENAVANYKGRYASLLKSFQKDGQSKSGGSTIKPVDLFMAEKLMSGAVEKGIAGAHAPSEDLCAAVKTMTTTGTGTGLELVEDGVVSELWQDFFGQAKVAGDIPRVPMTSAKMNIKGMGRPTWAKGLEGVDLTPSDDATINNDLDATEQVAGVEWSYNLDEESVIALMPEFRRQIAESGAEQMDAFILNADSTDAATGNINLDDANPANTAYYLSDGADGIRHLALVNNTGQGSSVAAAISDAGMATLLAKLGKYALDPQNLRIVPDAATYLTMLGLTNVATVDKYGLLATIITGELGRYRGIPIVPSASMPLTEADGKCSTTAASNTKGQIAVYHKNMWRLGFFRGLTIEAERLIKSRKILMVASYRIAVACYGTRSTAKHTAVGYNITV